MAEKKTKKWNYAEWWVTHRDEILAKRRERYRTDAKYRRRLKASAKKYKAEQQKQPKKGDGPGKRGFPMPKMVMIGKEQVLLQSFGYLRSKCGLHKLTLTKWLEQGVLPDCCFVDDRGRRWFPEPYVEFVRHVVELRERERESGGENYFLEKFKLLVQAEWIKALKLKRMPDMSALKER